MKRKNKKRQQLQQVQEYIEPVKKEEPRLFSSIARKIENLSNKKKVEPEVVVIKEEITFKKALKDINSLIKPFLFKHKQGISIGVFLILSFFIGKYSSSMYNSIDLYFNPPKKKVVVDKLILTEYTTQINDSIEDIANKFKVTKYTVKSSNDIYKDEVFRRKVKLVVPNKNVTLHRTLYQWNYTLEKIAKKYHVPVSSLKVFYEEYITSTEGRVRKRTKVFFEQKEITSDTRLKAGYVTVPQLYEKNFEWPLDMAEVPPYIRSGYGWRRNPFNWRHWEMHLGIDIACDRDGVLASKSGRVVFSGVKKGYGLVIIVEHVGGFITAYAHLSKVYVRQGAYIYQGKKIALSGNTGRSTGPHLHFEIRKGDRFEDPFHYLKYIEAPPVEKNNTTNRQNISMGEM